MGAPLERLTVRRGEYLTNGTVLVRVHRVLESEVLVEDVMTDANHPEYVSLSNQDLAAYRNVELHELPIREDWRLTPANAALAEVDEQADAVMPMKEKEPVDG